MNQIKETTEFKQLSLNAADGPAASSIGNVDEVGSNERN
jgi:hypothetical protein